MNYKFILSSLVSICVTTMSFSMHEQEKQKHDIEKANKVHQSGEKENLNAKQSPKLFKKVDSETTFKDLKKNKTPNVRQLQRDNSAQELRELLFDSPCGARKRRFAVILAQETPQAASQNSNSDLFP